MKLASLIRNGEQVSLAFPKLQFFGPFLFNIFMWDFENNYFTTSNADETTPNVVGNKTEVVLAERHR